MTAFVRNAGSVAASTVKPTSNVLLNVGQMIPIVGVISSLFREIIDLAEKAGHNKKVCRRLTERIRVANQTLTQIADNEENNLALQSYVRAIEKCKHFIDKVSKAGSFMKMITAHEIEADYRDITEEFDAAVAALGLSVGIRTRQDIEDDRKLFLSEVKTSLQVIEEVMKGLFESGMNVEQKLSVFENKLDSIHTAISNVNKEGEEAQKMLKNSRIPSSRIFDNEEEIRRGNGQIWKKIYVVQPVAQKEIGHIETLQKSINLIEKQVAILTELKNCQNIITFYGTMQRSNKLYIISEWAEKGDLNQYLKDNPVLDWDFKLRIASEIAGGLAFCHVCDILHHDIRSHNILLTENLTAKISNFSSSRKESDDTTQVKDITFRYRWLAPEKLKNYADNEYTKQCDIYSFAIVLWELASQSVPFADVTVATELIVMITVNDERPPMISNTPPAYEKMMQQGWHKRPIKRPTADHMFKELKNLIRTPMRSQIGTESFSHYASLSPISLSPRSNRSNPGYHISSISCDDPQEIDIINSSYQQGLSDDFGDSGQADIQIVHYTLSDINEAKKLHVSKRYKEAWPIFKAHADNGDAIAEFYVGYYLITGDRGVPQDKVQAIEYFRRSAEKNFPDAQFRYGVALLNGEGITKSVANDKIAIDNLERAAKHGNPYAMFNYGDLLINGAHGVTMDLEQGARWMKQAHEKNHPHAYKKLADRYNALNMTIPDYVTDGLRQRLK